VIWETFLKKKLAIYTLIIIYIKLFTQKKYDTVFFKKVDNIMQKLVKIADNSDHIFDHTNLDTADTKFIVCILRQVCRYLEGPIYNKVIL
jgi:hypothetical protein